MRLLLKIDYSRSLLFAPNTNVGPFIDALNGVIQVREEGYGAERTLVPVTDAEPLTFVMVADDAPSLPDNGDVANPFVTALAAAQKTNNTTALENYSLKAKVKELETKLATVTKAAGN